MTVRAKKVLAYGAATAVLLGVFFLYTRPDMMVTVGEMVWACFQ
jgi:hypothetical protein